VSRANIKYCSVLPGSASRFWSVSKREPWSPIETTDRHLCTNRSPNKLGIEWITVGLSIIASQSSNIIENVS